MNALPLFASLLAAMLAMPAAPLIASAQPSRAEPADQRALIDRYCVTCHNTQLRTAELMLDTLDLDDVGGGAAVWEKVVRKLRTGAMPPAGRPRPAPEAAGAFASWLEAELDRAAAAAPHPGRRPAVHRLTRTEYQHAVRDLLALDDLPKELDLSVVLPGDDSASGFDNLADVLFVSPTLLEGYLSAARKISRLAVGDPTSPAMVDIYTLPLELPQDRHLDGLPFGTRGGLLIRRYFPLDGEYTIKLEIAGANAREAHEVEVSVDGARVHVFTVGGRPAMPAALQYDAPDDRLSIRVPVTAGPRSVAVAFLEKTSAPGEEIRRPFRRARGRQPSITSVTISGPDAVGGPGETPSRRRIFACHPATASEEAACASRILSALARRAHRRPATDADLDMLRPFYEAGHRERGFEAGIQQAIERLLVSPEFLYRIERDPPTVAPGAAYAVTDLELASRLSFFLWSSIPDDELLEVAIRGELRDLASLERQVRRMLADSRAEALVTNFAAQWLFLRDLEVRRPDDRLFPNFDAGLKQALRRETELFLASVLREDRSVRDLLQADDTFVNERLAQHYGIPNVYGSHFRRVALPDGGLRRGLLGHGSILTLTSYANRTSPVLRGKWILENILASPPPPPPPNVPPLRDTDEKGKVLSMRERMAQHRASPVCASCHARMDPLGLALENFDAVGRWRTLNEAGAPIDASGTLPDGTKFDGIAGLRGLLLRQPEEFVMTVAEKLLTYALGRRLEYYDAPAVRAIVRDAARGEYRWSSLILGIVTSTPFQMRQSAAAPAAIGGD